MSWNNPSASTLPNTNEIHGGPGSYLLTNVLRGFDGVISSSSSAENTQTLRGYRTRLYICFVQLDSAVISGRPNAGGDATNLTHTSAKLSKSCRCINRAACLLTNNSSLPPSPLVKDMLALLPPSPQIQTICQHFRTYCRDFGAFRGVDPVYLTLLGL